MKDSTHRALRNRTLVLSEQDVVRLRGRLLVVDQPFQKGEYTNRTILGDTLQILPLFPKNSVDLLIVDPPYNLTKSFSGIVFRQQSSADYEAWLHSWISLAVPLLKPSASAYVCSEWRSSAAVQRVLETYFVIQNRITWEREKGRGALRNWKNCSVPFWSMPENTDHPTQKPEKLIAKLILASSKPGDLVLDPFLGSGTTSVVAKRLGQRFTGIELEEVYCLLAERRLEMADAQPAIQGYSGGYFWERNTMVFQDAQKNGRTSPQIASLIFSRHTREEPTLSFE